MTSMPGPAEPAAGGTGGALLATSRLLEVVNGLGRWLYRSGLRRTERLPVPVISVGNLVLGGSGKTPLVEALARVLLRAGARPAILTRGYRRRDRHPALIDSERDVAWESVGDEPAMLARALPGAVIAVDHDRLRGARRALDGAGATHLILDDGFQHWRLARDLDVVALDSRDPLSERAPRRENPSALRRAHAIVLTGAPPEPPYQIADQLEAIFPTARVLVVATTVMAVRLAGERLSPGWLAGRRVVAAAGIAGPERFFATLRQLAARPVRCVPFPDHHPFSRRELEDLLRDAAQHGATPIVTAKDAVKVPADLLPSIAWLEIAATCVRGSFRELLARFVAADGRLLPPAEPSDGLESSRDST
jgi:tetraacyldisaccharide 4'-kinase